MKRTFTQLLNISILLLCCNLFVAKTNAQTYCVPVFTSGCSGWSNDSIKLNTLDWHLGSTACTSYDYTTTSTSITAGTTYTMSVTSGAYTGCSVWVDLNGNGIFDTIENIYHKYTAYASPGYGTYTFTVTIPSCTPTGAYRMRVLAGWGTDGYTSGQPNGWGPCGSVDTPFQYGNFDDFTLNVTGTTTCDTPTALTAVAVDTTSVTFHWKPTPCEAGGSEYVLSTSSVTPTGAGTITYDTFYHATGLISGEVYYFYLLSRCSGTDSSAWIMIPVTTLSSCGVPLTPTVSAITPTSASFAWSHPAAGTGTASGYHYVLNTTGTTPTVAGTATAATSYAATGLTPGTTYYFYVRTNCTIGDSSSWVRDSFTTPLACDPPTGFTVTGITPTGATVNWTTPAGATVGGYQYVVNTSASTPTAPGTSIPSGTSYTLSGLSPATTYHFHIRTMCADGDSSAWVSDTFTTHAACNIPLAVSVSSLYSSSATLTWLSPGAGAAVGDYEYVLDETATDPTITGTTTTLTSYTASGLTPLTTYYFHIRTKCADGDESNWETISFKTPAPCGNAVITTNDITYHGVHIVWTSVTNAVQYQYLLDQSSATPTVPGTSTTDTEYNLIGLNPLNTYYFHLQVICDGGTSPWQSIHFSTTRNTTGVSNINSNDGLNINLAPNPAKDFVNVSIDGEPSGNAYIQLVDMTGRTLQNVQVIGKTVTLNLSSLPQGMYFVHYTDDINKETVKLIK